MFLWRKRTTPPTWWRRRTSRNCCGGASLPSNVSRNCWPTACSSVIEILDFPVRNSIPVLWLRFSKCLLCCRCRLGTPANRNEADHHQRRDRGNEHPDKKLLVSHPFLDITA